MKKLMVTALTTVVLSLSAQAQASVKFDKQFEKQLVSVCEAIQSNNKLKLHRVMKNNRFKYASIAKGLRCNGVDALSFAIQHNADTTAEFVAKRANIDLDSMLAKR